MKKTKRRLLSLLTLVLLLVPMLALSVFAARSDWYSFGFVFNGNAGTQSSNRAVKSDTATRMPADVSISSGNFGGNSVTMWIERYNGGGRLTEYYSGIKSTGSRVFNYTPGCFDPSEVSTFVNLYCRSYGVVQGLGGSWCP